MLLAPRAPHVPPLDLSRVRSPVSRKAFTLRAAAPPAAPNSPSYVVVWQTARSGRHFLRQGIEDPRAKVFSSMGMGPSAVIYPEFPPNKGKPHPVVDNPHHHVAVDELNATISSQQFDTRITPRTPTTQLIESPTQSARRERQAARRGRYLFDRLLQRDKIKEPPLLPNIFSGACDPVTPAQLTARPVMCHIPPNPMIQKRRRSTQIPAGLSRSSSMIAAPPPQDSSEQRSFRRHPL